MWTPVDTKFFDKKLPVGIANVYSAQSALLFRTLLEDLGAVVLLHNLGTPGDFLEILAQGEDAPPYLIIAGHGDENGIVFGEFMESIDTSMLVEQSMPAKCIAQHINLPGTFVINLCCESGQQNMAEAFLAGGTSGYIGTDPNPPAVNHPLFIAHFFHSVIRRKKTPIETWRAAAEYDSRSKQYLLFNSEGRHQVE
ncbi:MAG: hypothetical protein O2954_04850 [bacterium]|nr:hypothetical protein [bacterium]